MKRLKLPTVAILSLILAQPLLAEESLITGLFSTFRLSENSGDIVGAEIHIVPNPVGYSRIVQASEGAPGFPEVLSLTVKGNSIEFLVPRKSASGLPPGKYVGTITKDGLRLQGLSDHYKNYVMPRTNSYWP